MPAGHEVFDADQTWLNESRSEEEPAVRALRNRRVGIDAIDSAAGSIVASEVFSRKIS